MNSPMVQWAAADAIRFPAAVVVGRSTTVRVGHVSAGKQSFLPLHVPLNRQRVKAYQSTLRCCLSFELAPDDSEHRCESQLRH